MSKAEPVTKRRTLCGSIRLSSLVQMILLLHEKKIIDIHLQLTYPIRLVFDRQLRQSVHTCHDFLLECPISAGNEREGARVNVGLQ